MNWSDTSIIPVLSLPTITDAQLSLQLLFSPHFLHVSVQFQHKSRVRPHTELLLLFFNDPTAVWWEKPLVSIFRKQNRTNVNKSKTRTKKTSGEKDDEVMQWC